MADNLRVALYRNYREDLQPSMRIYADLLARHLPAAGVAVDEVRARALFPEGLRLARLASKLGDFANRYIAYPLTARDNCADVHHIVDHGNAHLLLALPRDRTVITCHDLIPLLTARGRLPRAYVPPTARAIFRGLMAALSRARLILTVSASTKADLVRELGCEAGRIRVVHLGLQNEHLASRPADVLLEAEVRLRLGPRPRILSVGVNWPYKNLHGVLEAFALVRREFPRATLVRVGAPLPPDLRGRAEALGVADAVHELGRLPTEDLNAVYRLADLLLFPSYYEGFGWPPLEAMAAGLPVVASPCGSIPEISGDVPLYAAPEDTRGLADAALRLVAEPALRSTCVARGLDRARGFTWTRTARQTADVYRELAER